MQKFAVVHFIAEDTVEVVPDFWIFLRDDENHECAWPSSCAFASRQIQQRAIPTNDWPLHPCRVLGTYGKKHIIFINIFFYVSIALIVLYKIIISIILSFFQTRIFAFR